jgi:hypothetical protein
MGFYRISSPYQDQPCWRRCCKPHDANSCNSCKLFYNTALVVLILCYIELGGIFPERWAELKWQQISRL